MSSKVRGLYLVAAPSAPGATAARAGQLWLATSRILLLGLSLLFLFFAFAGITVGMTVQAGVYLFGMVALNLPHGGFEHLLNLQARRTRFTLRYLAAFLLLMALFGLFFLSFPVAGLALALAVAMAKGGGADLKVMEACTGDAHLQGRGQRLLATLARGVPIMLLPILFFPGDFRFYSGLMVDLFAPGALGPLDGILLAARPWLGGLAFTLIAAHLLRGAARARRGSNRALEAWKHDALDTGLLVLFFTSVPVVLAVGLYFPLWYSARQIARSLASAPLQPAPPSTDPSPGETHPTLSLPAKTAFTGTDMTTPDLPGESPTGTDRSTGCEDSPRPADEKGVGREFVSQNHHPKELPWVYSLGEANRVGTDNPPGSTVAGEAAGEGGAAVVSGEGRPWRDPGRVAFYAWGAMMVGAGATLALAVGLWVLLPHLPTGLPWLMVGVAFWTVFISIIALPHVVIGEWFDRERGIWSGVLPSASAAAEAQPRA